MEEPLQLTFVNFKKDTYIIMGGKRNADRFFIIRQGKVRISKEGRVMAEERDGLLGPGDFFGVVSTMSGHSHIETAQAVTDTTLISVQKEEYSQLIQKHSSVAMKIIQQFSRRMRYLDEALTRLTLKNTAHNDASHLFNVAEYYQKQGQYNQAYYAYHQYIKHCPRGPYVDRCQERMMQICADFNPVILEFEADEFNRTYPKSCMIFSEGEPGDELYVIQKGSVKIAKIVDNNEVLLAVLKAGDIFGEMALLESALRSASAVAYEHCTMLVVTRANFERIVGTYPQIISRLTVLLAERIWFIYKQLTNVLMTDPLGRMYDALMIQLEKERVPTNIHQAYTFNFGPKELVHMVGLSPQDGTRVIEKLREDNYIQFVNDTIQVMDIQDIIDQTQLFRQRERLEKARREFALRIEKR
ncbi:MAG: cyclic nucleotide-binding domain-containing protein [Treponema sp.]|jgi:CRP-like cAMP-binding protein|nr:cyclic nucleotide-binding domain-containing protein [Treponema sp.]